MAKLTEKQRRFIEVYATAPNATQAAIQAGYAPGSADVAAVRLLANDSVRKELESRQAKAESRITITKDDLLKELCRIVALDIRELMAWGGDGQLKFKPSDEIDDATARCIQEVQVRPDGSFKFKLYSKEKAIELIAKMLGFIDTKQQTNVQVNLHSAIMEAIKDQKKKNGNN